MRKIMMAATAALALLAALPAQAQIKIGFIATMSGMAAAAGQDQYDGFMLGLEQTSGKLGGQTVQVIREDDQLKPDIGTQIVQKFIERDKVHFVVGITFSNVAMAIAKPLAEAGVFLISTLSGPAPLAGAQCVPNFFFTAFQNDGQFEAVGKYAADKNYKRVVMMVPNYQTGKDVVAGFKRFYKGEILDEVYTQLNQTDYSAEIAQMQVKNPDAVLAFFPGGMGINFVKQYQLAGMLGKTPLLSGGTIDGTTLPALKDIAVGVKTGSFWAEGLDNPLNKKFVADFEKKYGRVPSFYAAPAFDTVFLLDSALKKVKGNLSDKTALRAAIKAADFKSVRGPFKFNNNHFPIEDFYMFEVKKDSRGRVTLVTDSRVLTDNEDIYHSQCPLK